MVERFEVFIFHDYLLILLPLVQLRQQQIELELLIPASRREAQHIIPPCHTLQIFWSCKARNDNQPSIKAHTNEYIFFCFCKSKSITCRIVTSGAKVKPVIPAAPLHSTTTLPSPFTPPQLDHHLLLPNPLRIIEYLVKYYIHTA